MRLLPLFLFLFLVLDLTILPQKNSSPWFLLLNAQDVFSLLLRRPFFSVPEPLYLFLCVSLLVSHTESRYGDVPYCTIQQIVLPIVWLLSTFRILAADNPAHISTV